MFIYLLKFSVSLCIFIVFYKLFLEKEKMHQLKRYYLLAAILLALSVPLITFTTYIEPVVSNFTEIKTYPVVDIEQEIAKKPFNYLPIILLSIYGIGVILFGIKFILNLSKILFRIKQNPKRKTRDFTFVLLSDLIVPHTFFRYIFLNQQKFETQQIPKEVFIHEKAHAKQKHSIDILLIELLQILFWFNPLIYFMKQFIKMNHEFLADEAVLKQGIEPSIYQQLLLTFSSNVTEPKLANAINYSSIKKRFTVMKAHTSKQKTWLLSFLLLPLIALTLYGFSGRKQIIKDLNPITNVQLADSASASMMKEYKNYISKLDAKHPIINLNEHQRIVAIYDLMSSKQKSQVEKYPEIQNVDLSNTVAKKPTNKEFESWKNAEEFAVWIDGKHTKNSELNNYSVQDIYHYTGSTVHKNARSSQYPQPYQYHLYTQKDFEETFIKSKVNEYNQKLKAYLEATKKSNINKADDAELLIQKAQIDRIYKDFTADEIKTFNILKNSDINLQSQKKATLKEIAEYNKLAIHYNSQSQEKTVIKIKDMIRIRELHDKMTTEQKASAEPMPNFPPPPPPPSKDGAMNATLVNKTISPPPPPPPANASDQQKKAYEKAMEEYKIQRESYTYKHTNDKGEVVDIIVIPENDGIVPPPPPPATKPKTSKK